MILVTFQRIISLSVCPSGPTFSFLAHVHMFLSVSVHVASFMSQKPSTCIHVPMGMCVQVDQYVQNIHIIIYSDQYVQNMLNILLYLSSSIDPLTSVHTQFSIA